MDNLFSKKDLDGEDPKIFHESLRNALGYYTPSIEDIRVGYECELRLFTDEDPERKWKVKVLTQELVHNLIYANAETLNLSFRTPYLTKEQIEAEGWKYQSVFNAWYKGGVSISIKENRKFRLILGEFSILTLEIPSINEFRTIMKLLNIE